MFGDREGGRARPHARPARVADPRHRPPLRRRRRDALGRPGPVPSGQICEGPCRHPARRRLPCVRGLAGRSTGSHDRVATDARHGPRPPRGDGDPSAARPDRLVLRGELSAHASGDHGPRRSRPGARTACTSASRRRAIRCAATATTKAGSWLIFTGPSFKHGHVDEEREGFAEIERFAAENFGVRPDYRWTNEDYTPMDHAPFIGWSSSGAPSAIWSRPASTPGASPTAPPRRSCSPT